MNKNIAFNLIVAFFSVLLITSCENDLEVVRVFSDPGKQPDIVMTNFEIIYSDSAKVKARLTAPLMERYDSDKKKYSEFTKGLHVYFYNDSLKVNAEIMAKYAINYEKQQLWEGRNDVVVTNTSGDKLNTEQLFWDQAKKKIYTKKYCRVTKPDGTQHIGENGMEADQNLDNMKFFGSSGTLSVKDAEE
jgi:LPS export ABC transporter protein LptC